MKKETAERLLTVAEAREFLGVADRTIRSWIAGGRLPVVRLSSRCLRVRQADLDAFVRGHIR
jgi:excisionase family DNA binding protein